MHIAVERKESIRLPPMPATDVHKANKIKQNKIIQNNRV
jgi:hypothetical protein